MKFKNRNKNYKEFVGKLKQNRSILQFKFGIVRIVFVKKTIFIKDWKFHSEIWKLLSVDLDFIGFKI